MTADDMPRDEAGKYTAGALKGIAALVLFPFLWIAVTVNFLGVAERLSYLPGISREGGVVSGVAALVMTAAVLAVVVGGASAATGGSVLVIGGGDDGSADPTTPATTHTGTLTPTPMVTPTLPPRATATAKPTKTPEAMTDLEKFEEDYYSRVNASWDQENLTDVPVLATEYRMTDAGIRELWMVIWECDSADFERDQWVTVTNNFLNTLGDHNGKMPDRVRIYGVTNLKNFDDTISHIKTTEANAAYYGTMEPSEYVENWVERKHDPTETESGIAHEMVVNESGRAKADEAFNQHHLEVDGCPAGAEGIQDESSAPSERITE